MFLCLCLLFDLRWKCWKEMFSSLNCLLVEINRHRQETRICPNISWQNYRDTQLCKARVVFDNIVFNFDGRINVQHASYWSVYYPSWQKKNEFSENNDLFCYIEVAFVIGPFSFDKNVKGNSSLKVLKVSSSQSSIVFQNHQSFFIIQEGSPLH